MIGHTHTEGIKCYPACPGYEEPTVSLVTLYLCALCLDGAGGMCNVPGCALCRNRAPDLPLRDSPMVLRIESSEVASA